MDGHSESNMRLGILQTGLVPEHLSSKFGDYPEIFGDLYRGIDPGITIAAYPVVNDVFPESVTACDVWLITGSKYGVYENLPWMAPLRTFLQDARHAGVPMIGICFGHQIMAESFGGEVVKFDKGWACGPQDYSVTARPSWLADMPDGFTMHAMHQDQVVALPDDATRLATSSFCENAMLVYGDLDAPDAISIQPHPEFSDDFMSALLDMRSGDAVPTETADAARSRLGTRIDGNAFARWSVTIARRILSARDAA